MKICYFGDGTSIHIIRWCKHFASLGHEVHLISFKKVSIENVTTHFINAGDIAVNGGNWKSLLTINKVKSSLKKIHPDIFHAHYATSYGLVGALCNYHPYIITTLGSDVLISPQNSFIYKKIVQYVFKKADWITAMADHMKEKIIQLGSDTQKVETVVFGVDTAVFNSRNKNPDEKKFIITSTRNLEAIYNIPHIIGAVEKIKDKIPNLYVIIIGSGSLRKNLEELVKRKGLSEIVKFAGKITQNELVKALQTAHIFVSTSLSDGNNISLNEAMACGNLCIATDIPANQQWIKDAVNGFIVPINDINNLADKILLSYKHYNELNSKFILVNEKIISEKADWKTNMHQVEQKYLSLIRRNK